MKVAVIGCGYVGLVTGVGLSLKGHQVLAIDIDPSRVEGVRQGIVPFYEPGIAKALKACLKRGNLNVSNSMDAAVDCEVILICVQTPPQSSNGAINLQILKRATRNLESIFTQKRLPRTVVVRSTVIPGTTDKVVTPIFQKSAHKTYTAFNPEFLREGSALDDFLNPDRIVIGTHSAQASKILRQLYAPFNTPLIVTTPTTAELAKYASNSLLATLISFSNEIASVCERTFDTDVEDVLGIVHQDRRFKSSNGVAALGILSYLKAGCGFGGSCFPKDLSALIAYARSVGEKAKLLEAVEAVNNSQPIRVVDMVSEVLRGLVNRRILVLGAAFKGGTDDLRESPGLRIVDELLKRKARVTIYDPLVDATNLKSYRDKGAVVASNMKAAIKISDVCIIASNASEFNKLKLWKKLFKDNIMVVDGRRILKVPKNSKEKYYAIGLSKEGIYKF